MIAKLLNDERIDTRCIEFISAVSKIDPTRPNEMGIYRTGYKFTILTKSGNVVDVVRQTESEVCMDRERILNVWRV